MANNKQKKMVPELRFKGFHDDWVQRKLDRVADFFDNLRVPVTASDRVVGNTPYYGANGIQDHVSGYTHDGEFTLVAEDGANDLRTYPVNFVQGKVWVNNHAHVLSGKTGIADTQFLAYRIQTTNVYPYLVGGGRSKLNGEVLKQIPVRLPSTEEQISITRLISAVDQTIALQQEKLDLLKQLKRGYLQKLFPVGSAKQPELRFAGFDGDWVQRKLSDCLELKNGYAFKSRYFSELPTKTIVLTPGSVRIGGGYQPNKSHYYLDDGPVPTDFIFEPGDLYLTMTDLTPTAQTLGYPAYIPKDNITYLHNQRLGKLYNININKSFLFYSLTREDYHKEIVAGASGTTVRHTSSKKILSYLLRIPTQNEQVCISDLLARLDKTIALQQSKLESLKSLKQAYLQKLFV